MDRSSSTLNYSRSRFAAACVFFTGSLVFFALPFYVGQFPDDQAWERLRAESADVRADQTQRYVTSAERIEPTDDLQVASDVSSIQRQVRIPEFTDLPPMPATQTGGQLEWVEEAESLEFAQAADPGELPDILTDSLFEETVMVPAEPNSVAVSNLDSSALNRTGYDNSNYARANAVTASAADQTPKFPATRLQFGEGIDEFVNKVCSVKVTTSPHTLRWSLDDAINAALLYSYRVDELRLETLEGYQDIGIEFGKFDTLSFFEQEFKDSNEPVGDNFESDGSAQRIKGEDLVAQYGARRELRSGGQFEIANGFGTRDNNSGVLNPRDQANASLSLRFSKELLKGSGRSIAMNSVLVATQTAEAQRFSSSAEIVEVLRQVSEAYWEIFTARAKLVAAVDNTNDAQQIWHDLSARRNIDADPNLLEQARVAMLQQQAISDQSYAALAKAQFELISLVNAPELIENLQLIEIIPTHFNYHNFAPPDVVSRQNTAIHNRPEIKKVLLEIKRAQLEHHFAINELLPRLTFNAEGIFNGLSGNRDLAAAELNRFDSNGTYQLGFNFEFPLENRSARFNKRKRELTLAKLDKRWRFAVESVKKDVLESIQNLSLNHTLVQRQRQIFESSRERLAFLEQRRYNIPKSGAIPSLQLQQLLDVQSQLANAKADFAGAIGNRAKSQFDLNRASGILVREDPNFCGLTDPGSHQCFLIYRQYCEGNELYQEFSKCVDREVSAASKRDLSN